MTDRWAWSRDRAAWGYCLTLARHRTPGQIFAAFSVDRDTVLMATEVWAVQEFDDQPVIRAGQVGEWGFAFEPGGALGAEDDVLLGLSEGTEVVVLLRLAAGFAWFGHARDGVLVAGVDLNAPDRAGAVRPAWLTGDRDPLDAALQLIDREFGVGVTDETLRGTLLSGRRVPEPAWPED